MASKQKHLILKLHKNNFWKNNILNKNYSLLFFQLSLIKIIIKFFFLNSFSSRLLYQKKNKKNFFMSDMYINSINNSIIISINFLTIKNKENKNITFDNFLRLKYFYSLLNNNW